MEKSACSSLSLGERLVVALDGVDINRACDLVDQLADLGPSFKIGYQLLFSGGLELAQGLASQGLKVFLDAKLYDIPATVERGTRTLARHGFWCMTAHAQAQNIAGAVRGAQGTDLKILGVTVLTSMDQEDLAADGLTGHLTDQVVRRAGQALDAGAEGLIASPKEVAVLRDQFGSAPLIITPGVRPTRSAAGDQVRTTTPAQAMAAGADALVIGRPIVRAPQPLDAAKSVLEEIARSLSYR